MVKYLPKEPCQLPPQAKLLQLRIDRREQTAQRTEITHWRFASSVVTYSMISLLFIPVMDQSDEIFGHYEKM